MRQQVMQRAWELKRAGYASEFAACLRDAWAEAKGRLTIILAGDVQDIPTAEEDVLEVTDFVEPALRESEITWRQWWIGWLATAS